MGTGSKRIVMLMSGIFEVFRELFVLHHLKPLTVFASRLLMVSATFQLQKEHRTDHLLLLWLSSPALQSEKQAVSSRMNISPLKSLSHVPQPQALSIPSESFNMLFLRWLDVKMCFPLLLLHCCAFLPSTPLFSNCFNIFENKQCMRVQLAL